MRYNLNQSYSSLVFPLRLYYFPRSFHRSDTRYGLIPSLHYNSRAQPYYNQHRTCSPTNIHRHRLLLQNLYIHQNRLMQLHHNNMSGFHGRVLRHMLVIILYSTRTRFPNPRRTYHRPDTIPVPRVDQNWCSRARYRHNSNFLDRPCIHLDR